MKNIEFVFQILVGLVAALAGIVMASGYFCHSPLTVVAGVIILLLHRPVAKAITEHLFADC